MFHPSSPARSPCPRPWPSPRNGCRSSRKPVPTQRAGAAPGENFGAQKVGAKFVPRRAGRMKKRHDVLLLLHWNFPCPKTGLVFRPSKCARPELFMLSPDSFLWHRNSSTWRGLNKRGPSLGTARGRPHRRLPTCRVSCSRFPANVQPTSFSRSSFVRAAGARATLVAPLALARGVPRTRAPRKGQLRAFGWCPAPTLPRGTRPRGSRDNARRVCYLLSTDSTTHRPALRYTAPRRPAGAVFLVEGQP